MALALSLSLDLFLMKGNLLIAVRMQPETDRRGRKMTEQAQGSWRKRKQRKRRAEQRDVVNFFTKRTRERC